MEEIIFTEASIMVKDPYRICQDYEKSLLDLVRKEFDGYCRDGKFYLETLEITKCGQPELASYIPSAPCSISVRFRSRVQTFYKGLVLSPVKIANFASDGEVGNKTTTIDGTFGTTKVIFEHDARSEGLRKGLRVAVRTIQICLSTLRKIPLIVGQLYTRGAPLAVKVTNETKSIEWQPSYEAVADLLFDRCKSRSIDTAVPGDYLLSAGRFHPLPEGLDAALSLDVNWPLIIQRAQYEAKVLLDSHVAMLAEEPLLADVWKIYEAE
jgi:hypothetical protein